MGLDVRGAERSSEPGSFDRQHEVTVSQTLELVTFRPHRSQQLSCATLKRPQRALGDSRRYSVTCAPAMGAAEASTIFPEIAAWPPDFAGSATARTAGLSMWQAPAIRSSAVRDGRGLHIGNLRMRLYLACGHRAVAVAIGP